MSDLKIGVIVGSLRKDSINLKLARALIKLGKMQADFIRLDDLPFYNQDLESPLPETVTRFKAAIATADGILIATPEYNRSMPGVLKNAIDWASRPYGKNSFAQKPVGLIGTSPGAIGTACAQYSLRPVLACLDAVVMGQPELYLQFKDDIFDGNGEIANEGTRKFLSGFVDKFAAFVEAQG